MLDMFLFSIKINEEDQVFSYSANSPLNMYVFLCFFLFPFPLWNTQKAKNGKKKNLHQQGVYFLFKPITVVSEQNTRNVCGL